MTRISDIARQLCELQQIIDASDRRSLVKDGYQGHAQQVHEDATCMRLGLERALALEVADNPSDLLTQMLIFASTFMDSERPEPGEDFDVIQRLLVARMLEGLIGLSGDPNSRMMQEYFYPGWLWQTRVRNLSNSSDGQELTEAA